MGQSHFLSIVLVSLLVVVLFLWLSSEHKRTQGVLYSHLVHQRRLRLSGRHFSHQEKDYCDPSFKVISSIKNGVITINRTDLNCFGRCIERSKEYREANVLKPWEGLEDTIFTCETAEVVCLSQLEPELVEYRMLHRQFLNVRDFTSEPKTPKGQNILVFFMDRIGQREEFLPTTMKHLDETMQEATGIGEKQEEFRQIPLIYALFTGFKERNLRKEELCNRLLGNETLESENIFQTASREGYVTMFNDDSFRGIFKSLDCRQVDDLLVDHALEPFYTYTWNNWFMKYIFHGRGCQFTYRNTFNLIREVWKAYPERPIFSFNLISTISHKKQWLLPVFDKDLLAFLQNLPLSETMIILANLRGSEFRIFKPKSTSNTNKY